ncbi:MAG: MAPEG family protein [Alphaproteobacteria bacterium]|nr:MAPEG family protein [Alphaproteobacteria bacterium]MBU2378212.1 MAPEG family protein [Alphaproteobacteria bacterium]
MTPEFTMLAFTLILAIVQILAAATVGTARVGLAYNASPRDTARDPGVLAGRLTRAQANLFETLPLFAAAVIMAQISGENGWLTLVGTHLYFFGRLIYAPVYALGVPYVRSLIWVGSLVGLCMVIAALFV